jgi:hypothetical protein
LKSAANANFFEKVKPTQTGAFSPKADTRKVLEDLVDQFRDITAREETYK